MAGSKFSDSYAAVEELILRSHGGVGGRWTEALQEVEVTWKDCGPKARSLAELELDVACSIWRGSGAFAQERGMDCPEVRPMTKRPTRKTSREMQQAKLDAVSAVLLTALCPLV